MKMTKRNRDSAIYNGDYAVFVRTIIIYLIAIVNEYICLCRKNEEKNKRMGMKMRPTDWTHSMMMTRISLEIWQNDSKRNMYVNVCIKLILIESTNSNNMYVSLIFREHLPWEKKDTNTMNTWTWAQDMTKTIPLSTILTLYVTFIFCVYNFKDIRICACDILFLILLIFLQ